MIWRTHGPQRAPLGRRSRDRDGTPHVSWVDLVVVVLALIAAVSGWRHGMAVALLSFVGVLGGAILGVRLAPLLASSITNPNTRVVVSIGVVVLLVALGETTGVFFGRRIRDRIRGERTLTVDSSLGSVLQAVTVVLAAYARRQRREAGRGAVQRAQDPWPGPLLPAAAGGARGWYQRRVLVGAINVCENPRLGGGVASELYG